MIAFAEYINSILAGDKDLEGIIPVNTETNDLFKALASGVVFCKLINLTQVGFRTQTWLVVVHTLGVQPGITFSCLFLVLFCLLTGRCDLPFCSRGSSLKKQSTSRWATSSPYTT